MQFYSPQFLNLLWLAPVLAVCFIASGWLAKKRLGNLLKTTEIQGKLIPHYKPGEWPLRAFLLLLAYVFAVLALSQPQWGEEKRKIERKGVDVVFMLDVSLSMLAEDVKPNRVQKSKFEIESFIKSLKGDRVGMLTFAGSSFMQTPLTLDYSAFLLFLNGVDVGHVPDPGTSLGPAIQKAIEAFGEEKDKSKALVIFSDGEDHDLQIDQALETAKQKNVRIYTIGTGSAEGAPIPLKDAKGTQSGVKKDRSGNIVITKLNREVMEKLASQTGGVYLPATPGEKEIDAVIKHMASLGTHKLEARTITEKEDHYQIFVFIALACLILEMLVHRGKSQRASGAALLALLFMIHCGFIPTPQNKIDKGNEDFENKRYQSAMEKYREVQVKNPDSPPVEYNLATTLYKVDQFQESAAHLKSAVDKSQGDPSLQAKAAYNYGNALYRVGDFDGAIEAYKKALELNPNDKDAKYNLEVIQNKKSKFDKENQNRQQDKKNDQNKQQNQQNKQNQQNNKQNQSGGGSSQQDQNQGQGGQSNQGGGKNQNQDQQSQGGQGQNQQSSGQNQNKDQKDQGKGQNQKDDQQQGGQSDQNKNQNQQSGGQGSQDQQQNQEKDKSQNPQGGGQDKQDQNNQGGQGQNKNQNQGQEPNQQNRNQQPKGEGGNQQNKNPDQGQNQNQQPQGGGQSGTGQKPENQSGSQGGQQGQGQKPQQPGQGMSGEGGGQPLQGQMSKQDADYLLASLEEGEKKLHVYRKGADEKADDPYVEKDW